MFGRMRLYMLGSPREKEGTSHHFERCSKALLQQGDECSFSVFPTLESEGSLHQFGFLTLTLRNPRMFKMFMGPKPSLAITHPDLARQVLTRHQERDVSICIFSSQRPKRGKIFPPSVGIPIVHFSVVRTFGKLIMMP